MRVSTTNGKVHRITKAVESFSDKISNAVDVAEIHAKNKVLAIHNDKTFIERESQRCELRAGSEKAEIRSKELSTLYVNKTQDIEKRKTDETAMKNKIVELKTAEETLKNEIKNLRTNEKKTAAQVREIKKVAAESDVVRLAELLNLTVTTVSLKETAKETDISITQSSLTKCPPESKTEEKNEISEEFQNAIADKCKKLDDITIQVKEERRALRKISAEVDATSFELHKIENSLVGLNNEAVDIKQQLDNSNLKKSEFDKKLAILLKPDSKESKLKIATEIMNGRLRQDLTDGIVAALPGELTKIIGDYDSDNPDAVIERINYFMEEYKSKSEKSGKQD